MHVLSRRSQRPRYSFESTEFYDYQSAILQAVYKRYTFKAPYGRVILNGAIQNGWLNKVSVADVIQEAFGEIPQGIWGKFEEVSYA